MSEYQTSYTPKNCSVKLSSEFKKERKKNEKYYSPKINWKFNLFNPIRQLK